MKYWVFDLDGTLIDSFGPYFKALNQIFESCGMQFTDDLKLKSLTMPAYDFLNLSLGNENGTEAIKKLDDISRQDAGDIDTFEQIDRVLHLIKRKKDNQIAIWTSRELFSTKLILDATGIQKHIEICVSGSCVSKHKPDPEGLYKIIDHFGCNPHEVVMIGDHHNDVLAAKAAGSYAIRASWNPYWKADKCPHADQQFFNSSNFIEWIETLNT